MQTSRTSYSPFVMTMQLSTPELTNLPIPTGRLVIEIFEDQLPTTARRFMNRCREGMEDTFKGTVVHKLVTDLAAFGGQSKG